MPMCTLLTFPQLSQVFRLPGWMFFHYIQLSHVAKAQFSTRPLLQMDPVEEPLSQGAPDQPVSALYRTLLITDSPKD